MTKEEINTIQNLELENWEMYERNLQQNGENHEYTIHYGKKWWGIKCVMDALGIPARKLSD